VKTIVVITIGSIVSTLIIIQVLFLLFAAKPEVFGVVNNRLAVDSLQQTAVHDTVAALISGNHGDSLITEKSPEGKSTSHREKKEIKDSQQKKEEPKTVMQIPVADSVDVKAQAKMLEAMGADGAAKVLSTMNDMEVKAILPKLKLYLIYAYVLYL